jgi:tRNA nucleotidyltransferase (CCA-adding enzyme)
MVETGSSLIARLESSLSHSTLRALRTCEDICKQKGVRLYLVGGAVRDLALERPGFDVDLALETDVTPIAEELAAAMGARVVLHERFGTANVRGPGFVLDLARTRRETYVHPGALPSVEPATLAEDLARRDFTVNAIALQLSPDAGEVVDPYRGLADISSSLVRVLHDRSFQDDATRMLRAVRYAARLGFKIATQTEALIRRDLSCLGTVSGPRLRRELTLLFEDRGAVEGTLLAQSMGVLGGIHPALRLMPQVAERWRMALDGPYYARADEVGFCLVTDPRDAGSVASVSKWLHLNGRVERALADLVRLRAVSHKLATARARPSQAVELLEGSASSSIWALALLADSDTAQTCLSYLSDWRHVRPSLRGDDLLELGVQPGVSVGETLRRLRTERLEGGIAGREQEIEFVRRLVEKGE